MALLTTAAEFRQVLEQTQSIAVLGASSRPGRAGFYVGDYLDSQGYDVIPVNPDRADETIWGRSVLSSLSELEGPVDLIDVFRNPRHLTRHTDEILALPWRPRVVWMQLLVAHPPSEQRLVDAGIDVVVNRCTLAEHKRLQIGPKTA